MDPENIKWFIYGKAGRVNDLSETCAAELMLGRKVRDVHATKLPLKRNLDNFGTRQQCTDVRDRIYGLLALVNKEEVENLGLRPDYFLTAKELFNNSVRGVCL